jgi:aldehyde dehydrogenase (NAD+)
MEIREIFKSQTENRWQISQSTAEQRKEKLLRLKSVILACEQELITALYKDFRKPAPEVYLTEIYPTLEEINFMVSRLSRWMRPQKVKTPFTLFGARTEIRYEARGVCLIMAPWNYPFQLLMSPLAAAIAAGNCVIAKPSEKAPATAALISQILQRTFSTNEVAVVEGGVEVSKKLLELPFDHIFFTGSTAIGRHVMKAAAEHLSSVTLELGGKSPVIVLEDADLEQTAEKIVWGKFLNAGQTCVAPDYIFVPESKGDALASLLKKRVESVFGPSQAKQLQCPDFARIVDTQAWERLKTIYHLTIDQGARVVTGGLFEAEEKFMAPTIIDHTPLESEAMRQEIFGPLLPILRYTDLEEVIRFLQSQDKPLALYIFGNNQLQIERLIRSTSAGGTLINHLILQLANPHAPFGGVGGSGQGSYHGFAGFRAFSHERTLMRQGRLSLSSWLFPPYRGFRFQMIRRFLRFIS